MVGCSTGTAGNDLVVFLSSIGNASALGRSHSFYQTNTFANKTNVFLRGWTDIPSISFQIGRHRAGEIPLELPLKKE